jgi:hypothetical protein
VSSTLPPCLYQYGATFIQRSITLPPGVVRASSIAHSNEYVLGTYALKWWDHRSAQSGVGVRQVEVQLPLSLWGTEYGIKLSLSQDPEELQEI